VTGIDAHAGPVGAFGAARRVLCTHCAKKGGHLGPVSPDAHGDRGNHCVSRHGTAQILTRSQHSDEESAQRMFPPDNVRLLSESAVVALCTDACQGAFRGATGTPIDCRALRNVLCRNAPLDPLALPRRITFGPPTPPSPRAAPAPRRPIRGRCSRRRSPPPAPQHSSQDGPFQA